MLDLDTLYQKLREIRVGDGDVVSLGFIRDLALENGRVSFKVRVPAAFKDQVTPEVLEKKVRELPGVAEVHIDWRVMEETPARPGLDLKVPGALEQRIGKVIAVTSGKGGVGKSTVAANLAVALARLNKRVGLMDGDIYGPSIPKIFGIEEYELKVVNRKIIPVVRFGVKVLSIGLLVDESQPIVWRGPMVHKAYQQFLSDVEWGNLDYLILDLPPGTGDAQLSAVQLFPVKGGIAVTTPQDVSLADVRRAIGMLRKVDVPVLGLVENMSYLICPHCGEKIYVFGRGGGEKLAREMGVDLLAQIPLDPAVVEASDQGMPPVATHPNSPVAQAFEALARRVMEKLEG